MRALPWLTRIRTARGVDVRSDSIQTDIRDEFIREVVPGHSFADVGGLWGTVNEKVSVARAAGATSLAMIDLPDSGDGLWERFHERMRELGIGDVRCIEQDVIDLARASESPVADVVNCSGVLYHVAEPLSLLRALHVVTRTHLILTSAITALRVDADERTLEIPSCSMIFVPALRGEEKAIVRDYWSRSVERAIGLTEDTEWDPRDYDPWWWLPTVDALKALCATAGFSCESEGYCWNVNFYTLLLRRETPVGRAEP